MNPYWICLLDEVFQKTVLLMFGILVPESPMLNFRVENAMVNSERLFTAHDARNLYLKNVEISSPDSVLYFLDSENIMFDQIQFNVPGEKIFAEMEGEFQIKSGLSILCLINQKSGGK